jgi:hypothetical protein
LDAKDVEKKVAGLPRGGTTGAASAFEPAGGEPVRKGVAFLSSFYYMLHSKSSSSSIMNVKFFGRSFQAKNRGNTLDFRLAEAEGAKQISIKLVNIATCMKVRKTGFS